MNASRWVLSALLLGGCAGAASADLGDRVSRLETRVQQLEAPTAMAKEAGAAQNAGDPRGLDGGGHDASLRHRGRRKLPFRLGGKPKWDGGVRIIAVADSGQDAFARFQSCLEHAERRCRQSVVEERSASGLKWKRRVSLARAQDTAAGRKCLATAQRGCKRSRQATNERDQRFAKLDAELTPKNIDQAFTARLQRVLAQDAGANTVHVVCTKRFCRLRGVRRHVELSFQVSRLMPNSTGGTSWGGTMYITRNGYLLPL